MLLSLKSVFDEAVKIIAFIRSQPWRIHLCQVLCGEVGSTHETLLLRTQVPRSSREEARVQPSEL